MFEMNTDPGAPMQVKVCMFLLVPALAWIELVHKLTNCTSTVNIRTIPKGE